MLKKYFKLKVIDEIVHYLDRVLSFSLQYFYMTGMLAQGKSEEKQLQVKEIAQFSQLETQEQF